MIDWVQLNTEDVEQNDLWSMYLPPKVCWRSELGNISFTFAFQAGLILVRDTLAKYQPAKIKKFPPIIYIHRWVEAICEFSAVNSPFQTQIWRSRGHGGAPIVECIQ